MLYPLSYEGRRGKGIMSANGQSGAQGVGCSPVRGIGSQTSPRGLIDLSTGTGASDLLHAEDHGVDEIVAGKAPVAARSPLQLFWRRFRKDKVALAARIFIVLLILIAIFAPLIRELVGRARPERGLDRGARRLRAADGPERPSTCSASTSIGRDIFSRVLDGAQVSLMVAFIGTGLSVLIGVTMGMIAGFYRGWVDTAIAR